MRGAVLFNGNAETVDALVQTAAPLLLSSRHEDPEVARSRRVVLVTAAWGDGEHDEGHVKRSLNAIGLPSRFEHGYDTSLVNLSLLHEVRGLARTSPRLLAAWHEERRIAEMARAFYLEHNAHLIQLFRRTLAVAKREDPTITVARLAGDQGHYGTGGRLLRYTLSRELRHALDTLEANDDHLVNLLDQIEQRTFDAVGLQYDPAWRAAQERLERRILSANSIILFGGHLDLLLDALRFFRLRNVLAEALRRGTQLVAMSAGAMVLCERVIIYDDFATKRRDFQLYDRGLALVRDIQLFPHCTERIQTDDPDNLAYLARRFRHHACVGLNQRSFLLFELGPHRAASVGADDCVMVFDPSGRKLSYHRGEVIRM
ncbi:Type 1 glutamine amidotransferase-like domain-containing protein [Nannocystis bainbridge]|uniref:Type 1 glutamine amidotransferase-like domain-containing protein n=1 Tax=Nannocystis bainbridge TaxID=2995303 RepID=A0ABT5DWD7_9BACT|nr:Type 1 glutamine amidotransferase-like domain-containing protein [Nannocystis bainbridge]MDC0716732.1 Type 1 glutamine amidotransferase-like domain-containing protein [Nannocystis bainbridge]